MALGRQVLCEFWGAQGLDDEELARTALERAVEAGGATLVRLEVHRFSPWGISGIAVIAESHLALHTWPEHGYAAIDVFTCGDTDLDAMVEVMVDAYRPTWVARRAVERGSPGVAVEANGVVTKGAVANGAVANGAVANGDGTATDVIGGERNGHASARDGAHGDRVWTFEEHEPASPVRALYPVRRLLEARRTPFQSAVVFETPGLGRVLALDQIVQLTERDSFAYHEALVHPALNAHPEPRNVVIVGGGDGHTLAEVLKHDVVERVAVLELDEHVVELAKRHFETARAAFADPRVEFLPGDAFTSIGSLDFAPAVILCDLPDPLGQAARLFGSDFYRRCAEVLTDDGLVAAQTESPFWHPDTVRSCREAMAEVFPRTAVAWSVVPTYPGAWWTFTIGSKRYAPEVPARTPELDTRLYRPECHAWMFVPQPVWDGLLAPTAPPALVGQRA